jgi:hypothetical protein
VVASWDYHRGAKIRGSVRGNPGRFNKSYDRELLRVGTRLGLEQLWPRTPILVTSRTWCKSKTNKLLQILGSITARYERYSSLQKAHTSIIFLKEHMEFRFLGPF